MKNQILKKIIKEEILKVLKEENKNSSPEKISGADFNDKLLQFQRDLRTNKAGLGPMELKNLLDLFELIVEFAREYNLTQSIEDRMRKIVDPRGKLQNQIDNPKKM